MGGGGFFCAPAEMRAQRSILLLRTSKLTQPEAAEASPATEGGGGSCEQWIGRLLSHASKAAISRRDFKRRGSGGGGGGGGGRSE